METIVSMLKMAEWGLLIYLGASALYFLFFSIASHFYREKKIARKMEKQKVTVIIPAYKEDAVILEATKSAVKHRSKNAELQILVVADSLKPRTITQLNRTGADVLTVTFEKSTKSKSINTALATLSHSTDYVVILDADNLMQPEFIDELLNKAKQGYEIVQGHRTAKNSNTNFAFLDGISEEVNNAIFRKGHRTMGLSASLIGSGFICEFKLMKELMKDAEAVGGFDKELELMLLEKRHTIAYAENAIVLDEKVQQSSAFINQRRRWISVQYIYFSKNIKKGVQRLVLHGNIDYFDKLMQFLVPPRILALGATFIFAAIYGLLLLGLAHLHIKTTLLLWAGSFAASAIAILLAIPIKKYNKHMLKALLEIPKGFFLTFLALLKIRGANKQFIHTKHGIEK